MRQQQESLGCMLFLSFLITPLFLFFGFREIYFNVISVPTIAKLLDDKGQYGNTLEFTTRSGETVIVERVKRCGLGRGKRSNCIP